MFPLSQNRILSELAGAASSLRIRAAFFRKRIACLQCPVCYSNRVNVDAILTSLNDRRVEYLLIGGMNLLLRHRPVLTLDVDVWIHDLLSGERRQ